MLKHFQNKHHHDDIWQEFIHYSVKQVNIEGLKLEFGVGEGKSADLLCSMVDMLYGFDSFFGLPEEWWQWPKGTFSTSGKCLVKAKNFMPVVGLFADTLPEFVAAKPDQCALIHIDCDLYSSTKTVFEHLHNQIKDGTVIIFDEALWKPSFMQHETRAFLEFAEKYGLLYETIAYTSDGQWSIRICQS